MVEVLSPLGFVSWPVGKKILGVLVGGILGELAVFPPWIFIEGGGLLLKQSSPL